LEKWRFILMVFRREKCVCRCVNEIFHISKIDVIYDLYYIYIIFHKIIIVHI